MKVQNRTRSLDCALKEHEVCEYEAKASKKVCGMLKLNEKSGGTCAAVWQRGILQGVKSMNLYELLALAVFISYLRLYSPGETKDAKLVSDTKAAAVFNPPA